MASATCVCDPTSAIMTIPALITAIGFKCGIAYNSPMHEATYAKKHDCIVETVNCAIGLDSKIIPNVEEKCSIIDPYKETK